MRHVSEILVPEFGRPVLLYRGKMPQAKGMAAYVRDGSRPSTAPGLVVCEWSPEGLHDKSVSWIPNTDEILKLLKKKMN